MAEEIKELATYLESVFPEQLKSGEITLPPIPALSVLPQQQRAWQPPRERFSSGVVGTDTFRILPKNRLRHSTLSSRVVRPTLSKGLCCGCKQTASIRATHVCSYRYMT